MPGIKPVFWKRYGSNDAAFTSIFLIEIDIKVWKRIETFSFEMEAVFYGSFYVAEL